MEKVTKNRKRNKAIYFRLSEKEYKLVQDILNSYNDTNTNTFIKIMLQHKLLMGEDK